MTDSPDKRPNMVGADLIVSNLVAHGVTHVFGIPGAKVDRLFDALVDSPIETIVTRHEQNAAFIAAGVGRLTGRAGVALGTSGPGASNLLTGLATATSEGDPVLAIAGAVRLADRLKLTHQTMDTVSLFKPVTKLSQEIPAPSAVSETIANALRAAESGRPGAAFVSTPMDILNQPACGSVLTGRSAPAYGRAPDAAIEEALVILRKAKRPVFLLGMMASQPSVAKAIQKLVAAMRAPVVGTFQAAGALSEALVGRFGGRVGLFRNQHGDRLLDSADLVIAIGYDPVEYDPVLWNTDDSRLIVHIDTVRAEIDNRYAPSVELLGDIAETVLELSRRAVPAPRAEDLENILRSYKAKQALAFSRARSDRPGLLHPLEIVHELADVVGSDMTVCLDMGSFHIWMARYMLSFRPRQLLISNGQQTMGVGLPWGIAASIVQPSQKVISVSGDGGFMMSSMELETAVRLKCNLIHVVWVDQAYNMVEVQERKKYGRQSGVEFGPIDFAAYAVACGAHGMTVHTAQELRNALRDAMELEGPIVISVPVDYSHNVQLLEPLGALGETSAAA